MESVVKFEVGKSYKMFSPCDTECVWRYKVVKRTACTITITAERKQLTCRVKVYNGEEICQPLGRYSMSPILGATKRA